MHFLKTLIDHYPQLKYTLLEAQTFDPAHYGFPDVYYHLMESDQRRVGAFVRAFQKYDGLAGQVVCEAGVGRLALTQHYLPKVKKAYLIESNPALIDFIKMELSRNGWTHKTELIVGDARSIQLPEPLDCIIGEMMSIFGINEHQIPVFQHLRQFLKPGGQLIPARITNLTQLANATFENGHDQYPLLLTRHWPEILSTQTWTDEIDLYQENRAQVNQTATCTAYLSGEVNAILMRSLIELAEGINFTGTDALMPPTVARLQQPIRVVKGQDYQLNLSYTYGSTPETAQFWITPE